MFPKLFPEVPEAVPGPCRGLAPPLRAGCGCSAPASGAASAGRPRPEEPPKLRGPAAAPPPPARPRSRSRSRRGRARLPAGRSRCGRGAAGMSEAEGGSAAAAVEKPPLPAAGPGAAAAVAAAVAAAAAAGGPEPGAPAEEAAVVWSPEVEVCLFHAMLGHKPVGERGPRPPGAGPGGEQGRAAPAASGAAPGPAGPRSRRVSAWPALAQHRRAGQAARTAGTRLPRQGHSTAHGTGFCPGPSGGSPVKETPQSLRALCPVLAVKKGFLLFRWSFLRVCFCPLLYVLLLCTTEQSLDPSSWQPSFRYL